MAKLTPLQKARRKWILKKRRELGLCVQCGSEANGNSSCDRCQERTNEATRARREKAATADICQNCFKKRRGVGSTVMSAIKNSGCAMKIESTAARDCVRWKGATTHQHGRLIIVMVA